MSWQRLIELLTEQEHSLAQQDFPRHQSELSPAIEAEIAALSGGEVPSDAQRERIESLLDATLRTSLQRIARTGAALRHREQELAAKPPRLIDRKG